MSEILSRLRELGQDGSEYVAIITSDIAEWARGRGIQVSEHEGIVPGTKIWSADMFALLDEARRHDMELADVK